MLCIPPPGCVCSVESCCERIITATNGTGGSVGCKLSSWATMSRTFAPMKGRAWNLESTSFSNSKFVLHQPNMGPVLRLGGHREFGTWRSVRRFFQIPYGTLRQWTSKHTMQTDCVHNTRQGAKSSSMRNAQSTILKRFATPGAMGLTLLLVVAFMN